MKKVVLIGAGHAHLYSILRIADFKEKGAEVTVISPCCYYYSGMIPGVLGGRYTEELAQLDFAPLVTRQGGTWIEEKAVAIDPVKKTVTTESGITVSYDILSADTGSYVDVSEIVCDSPEAAEKLIPVRPFSNIPAARRKILSALEKAKVNKGQLVHAAVLGGGPAGVEIAGSLAGFGSFMAVTLFTGRQMLPGFPLRASLLAIESLEKRGAEIIKNAYAEKITEEGVVDHSGKVTKADIIFAATGVKLSPLYKDSGFTVSSDNGMVTDRYLCSVDYPSVFGGGDCITFSDSPLPKAGVFAVRQGPVLYNNIMAAAAGFKTLKPYLPRKKVFLAMNMGDGSAVGVKGSLVFKGRLVFRFKEYLDIKFIKTLKKAVSGKQLL